MTIDDKIKDEKLQCHINRGAAYLTGEEILSPNQRRVIEQDKFTYSPLEKAFEKQMKTIENQGEKQIYAIEEHRKQ